MKAIITTHINNVKEYVHGIKEILINNNEIKEYIVDDIKNEYKLFYNKCLKGNTFKRWITVFDRGESWDFVEKIIYHPKTCMLEYEYKSNNNFSDNDKYLKRFYI